MDLGQEAGEGEAVVAGEGPAEAGLPCVAGDLAADACDQD